MTPTITLVLYCLLILVASLLGGWIPSIVRLSHTRVQLATSFVAGLMLGVGMLHLLPHAWHQVQSIDTVALWVLAGFLLMFLVQRFFHFHEHEAHEGEAHGHGAERGPAPAEHARGFSWMGAAFGLTLHTLVNGVALAASVEADSHSAAVHLFGFSTFLVIFLHKPFDAMVIATLMRTGGWSGVYRNLVNGLFALVIPVGAAMFYLGAAQYTETANQYIGCALAFSAGTFLCISTSDLLPELQFHAHDRGKLSAALLLGLLLSVGIGKLESSGHDHHVSDEQVEEADHLTEDPHVH